MLNVHEYPRYIWSQRALTELKEGMTISNEPGFYKEGEFGIRIENVMYVKKSQHVKFLEFEMLTLVPYSRDLIDLEMLTKSEKEFLKRYYSRIKELVLPSLSHNARTWCEYEMGLELL
jgi:Xaa-Pro aminopeptidase